MHNLKKKLYTYDDWEIYDLSCINRKFAMISLKFSLKTLSYAWNLPVLNAKFEQQCAHRNMTLKIRKYVVALDRAAWRRLSLAVSGTNLTSNGESCIRRKWSKKWFDINWWFFTESLFGNLLLQNRSTNNAPNICNTIKDFKEKSLNLRQRLLVKLFLWPPGCVDLHSFMENCGYEILFIFLDRPFPQFYGKLLKYEERNFNSYNFL